MNDCYFAALEVVNKSQLHDGSYKKTSEMTPVQRAQLKRDIQDGAYPRTTRNNARPYPGTRDLKSVYRTYGVRDGITEAMKEDVRRSTRYKNLHFGHSITPEMQGQIENSIDPKVLRSARRGVVFHHGNIAEEAAAAATPAHSTTGGKGRVIINARNINANGRPLHNGKAYDWAALKGQQEFHEVINHETVHANKKRNPVHRAMDGKEQHRQAMAEEARADGQGVRGRGLYQRGPGGIGGDREIHDQPDWEDRRTKQSRYRYNAVHDKVQDAFGTREPGQPRSADAQFRRQLHGLPPKGEKQPLKPILRDVRGGTRLNKPLIIGGAAAALVGAAGLYAAKNHGKGRDGDGDGILNEKENRR